MNQKSCPELAAIKLWLTEEDLPHNAQAYYDLTAHVDTCQDCQARVEALISESSSEIDIGSNLHTESVESLAADVALRVKQHIRKQETTTGHLAPGMEVGDYEIVEWVGGGASSQVYRARDRRLSRSVALKVLHQVRSSNGQARLIREAKAAAALNHEHIVALYDVQLDAQPDSYLVMEWVSGGTVQQRIRSDGQLDSQCAAQIAAQVALALSAAHKQGLVHRDLKSANVLLADSGVAKLADFGLVRDLESDSQLTRDNVVAGTPAYMAPEQIHRPNQVDGRADQYSLGVMLYEMLTGELPFRGKERMILQQAIHETPRSPRTLNDLIPRDLETICLKCLSKLPAERYESAQHLHQDLLRYLNDEPILARPVSSFGKAWRWCRSHAALSISLAVTGCALLCLAVGSTIAAIQLRSASLKAKRNEALAVRGKDHLQDTLRQLIYDVNDVLDADEVDLDEAQERLLVVAIDGLRKAAELGEGAQDESSAASKNRLAQVLVRLGRDKEAKQYFQEALEETEQLLQVGNSTVPIWLEKLNALQGLASLALSDEGEGDAFEMYESRILDEVPVPILNLSEKKRLAKSWLDEISLLCEKGSYKEATEVFLKELDAWEVDFNSDEGLFALTNVLDVARQLDAGWTETGGGEVEQVWDSILAILQRNVLRKDLTTLASIDLDYAQYVCYDHKSWIAYDQSDFERFVNLQQTGFGILPRDRKEPEQFEWSLREAIHDDFVGILDATINEQSDLIRTHKDWFLTLAKQDIRNVQRIQQENQGADGIETWAIEHLICLTHHAQILEIVGDKKAAKVQANEIESELQATEFSDLSQDDADLVEQIRVVVRSLLESR